MDLAAKKRLDAKGRDGGSFMSPSPSLGTSVAEALFVSRLVFFQRPEAALCAQVGVVLGA